ncbi:BTB POZ domain-containing 6-like, partial [Paramuricea clavata]
MASVQLNVDWQSTKNTILERNRHMFNNSDMSDISFTCEGSHKGSDKTFYAHKYVLSTSSAVFHAMFYGALAEKDSIVHLSDTNAESLEQFLRFLYTEECTLTADNVIAIMYLAQKYIIPSLYEKCVNFLLENLNPENVLDVLEQATRFDEKELEKRCWKIIVSKTGKVVASDSFNNISQTTLTKLLKRTDKINIPEVKLFQAVLIWIDFQCSCKNLEPTGENRRSVIGEAIYDFRFFSMSHKEFAQHVSKSGLLTAEEMIPIHEKFLGIDSPALKWRQPNRTGNIDRFSRFSGKAEELRKWGYAGTPDRLCFSFNEEVSLLGVRLFGDEDGSEYHVTFEVKEAKLTGTYVSGRNQDDVPGFDVLLKKPVILKQNEVVTLSATIKGPQSCGGNNGLSPVTLEGISVTFSNAPPPNNGTH